MRQTQIVTYGLPDPLAALLRELAQERRIWLRETSQLSACRNLVQTAAPPILVMVLGRDLERELALIEQVHASMPETAIVAIGEADNPTLAGLAWDLGATFVHFPPMAAEALREAIVKFLEVGTP